MHYEINVSLNGAHLFATHERSLTSERPAASLLQLFKAKFPESQGYTVAASLVNTTGRNVTDELSRLATVTKLPR